MWKRYLEELFSFSPSQFRGILILLILIFVATSIKKYADSRPAFNEKELTAFNHRVDSFERMVQAVPVDYHAEAADSFYTPINETGDNAIKLSDFNPDTMTEEDWSKTGLPENVVQRILHYEEKGGRFHAADDLKKIYGFPDNLFQKLKPFVKIVSLTDSNRNRQHKLTDTTEEISSIDINSADTTALKQLPGIGSKLAARIVKYRQKLGGFYSISQLSEVYGISPDVFLKIKSQFIVTGSVRQISINKAPYDSIAQQPYLKMLASKIIHCRKQNGYFHSLSELQSCAGINDSILQKISPYISF